MTTDHMYSDNGSEGSNLMYHGSDQSIANDMLGEQGFQREVLRRRLSTWKDWTEGRARKLEKQFIGGMMLDDLLNPSFFNQILEHKAGKPDEFGMGPGYFSELGHQTVNAENDARYITYSGNIDEQTNTNRHVFGCPSRVTGQLPADILAGSAMRGDEPA